MSYARRKDANHSCIVFELRALGIPLKETYQYPGMLDIILRYRDFVGWFEIKDGALPPSRQKLTITEEETFRMFNSSSNRFCHTVTTVEEILEIIGWNR